MHASPRRFLRRVAESGATVGCGAIPRGHRGRLPRLAAVAAVPVLSAVLVPPIPGGTQPSAVAADAATAPAPQPSVDQPPAAAAPSAAATFVPQQLSVGEPISLPNAKPLTAGTGPSAAASSLATSPAQAAAAAQPPLPATGTGWLGLAVDDTLVTGRLVVVEVAADSPAAKGGVRQQDVLLAINGTKVQTADEMAAVLAAIEPGQRVKVAVGRDSKVDDLLLTAAQRPAEVRSRDWRSTADATAAAEAPRSVLTADASRPPTAAAVQPAPFQSDLQPPAFAAAAAAQPLPPAMVPPTAPPAAAFAPAPASNPPAVAAPSPAAVLPATRPAALALPPSPLPTPLPTRPAQSAAAPSHAGGRLALGVRTVPVDAAVQARFQMTDTRGAYVIGVVDDLPAAKAGLPPGSVIVAVNQQPVGSPQELTRLVTHGPAGTPVTVQYVLPGGQARHASVVLQSLDEPLERALVGADGASRAVPPASLQPAPQPQLARRVEQASATQPAAGIEETLRRMATQLDQIDRRLERLESGR